MVIELMLVMRTAQLIETLMQCEDDGWVGDV
jgi:hypothetical protein